MQLWANRTLVYGKTATDYGCDGLLGIHWRTRAVSPQFLALAQLPWAENLTSLQLYTDIVTSEFGVSGSTAATLAEIFDSVDSYGAHGFPRPLDRGPPTAIPRPDNWIGGPGKISPSGGYDPSAFAFVDQFAAAGAAIQGADNLARFQYWLSSFEYLRSMAQAASSWGALLASIDKAKVREGVCGMGGWPGRGGGGDTLYVFFFLVFFFCSIDRAFCASW